MSIDSAIGQQPNTSALKVDREQGARFQLSSLQL